MNLVVNKKMNEDYLESYLTSIMNPNNENYTNFNVYISLSTNETINNSGAYPFIIFAPEGYLEIIDKLNLMKFNDTLSLGGSVDFTILMNTLYSSFSEQRNSALDYLVAQGILSESEITTAKVLTSSFKDFNISNLTMHYVDTTISGNETLVDVIEYLYTEPIELRNYYDISNNTIGDKIYMTILPLVNKIYGNTDGSAGDYVATHTFQNGESVVQQTSYIGIELGDINDANADIKYDHIDRIDFIDSFRLRFRLPKILS